MFAWKKRAIVIVLIFLISLLVINTVSYNMITAKRDSMLGIYRKNFQLFVKSTADGLLHGYFSWDKLCLAIINDDQYYINTIIADVLDDFSYIQSMAIYEAAPEIIQGDYIIYSVNSRLYANLKIYNDSSQFIVPDHIIRISFDIQKILQDLQYEKNFTITDSDRGYDFIYGLKVSYTRSIALIYPFVISVLVGLFFDLVYIIIVSKKMSYFYETEGLEKIIYLFEKTEEYSANHSRRVAMISVLLAEKVGIKGRKLKDIKIAAYLHDIGKISIPLEVLNKKGKLERDEFEVVKQHVIHSAEIVGNFKELVHLKDIVYYHHEKMDGSGYPQGLWGDQIPVESRIIAVADVFESLTGVRPYRDSMEPGKALKVMEEMSLDPVLFDILKREINSVSEIVNAAELM